VGYIDCASESRAAITTVNIGDNVFSPNTVTINVNDRVRWAWTGVNPHSSTSTGGLWDSGIHSTGFTFTNTFGTAGNFPYRCNVHAGQTGSVTVQSANVLPSIAITSPTAAAVLAAPWAGPIRASTSDNDGSVLKVDFFANTTLLGTVSNPPPTINFPVNNLGAGAYSLKAVAMDNRGATNTSAAVAISVLTPASIQLSGPAWVGGNSFQFSYSATTGLRYIVQKSNLAGPWVPVATNTAPSSNPTFTDTNAIAPFSFYSVTLAPNP
jgi:plastocyanin